MIRVQHTAPDYNEQREYDAMHGKIEEAEYCAVAAGARIGEPAVIADHKEMGAAQAEPAGLYARWEDLEERKNEPRP